MKLQTLGNFLKKESLAQMFSYEFCDIFMNTFFTEHIRLVRFEYVFIADIEYVLE